MNQDFSEFDKDDPLLTPKLPNKIRASVSETTDYPLAGPLSPELSMDNLRRRIGKFSISTSEVDDHPEALMQLFGKVIVVKAECVYYSGEFEYYALSPHFDIVRAGEVAPTYLIRYQETEQGVVMSFDRGWNRTENRRSGS